MRFEVLGPLRVYDGGRLIRVGGPREQKVLAALLLAAGRPVSQVRLASAVWADAPPATAKAQIHNSIAALRRTLGTAVRIYRTGPGFALDLDGHELDVAEFTATIAAAERLDDPTAAGKQLRAALALWRGPVLSGLADDGQTADWVLTAEVRRLEELRLAYLERSLALDLELGRHAELIAELRPLVAEHPLRERLHAQLMTALQRSGRRSEALQVYRELHRVLADELGLEPDPATQRMHEQLLRGGVEHHPPGPPFAVPAQLPPDVGDFVGRAGALSRLDTHLVGDVGRQPTAAPLILITGPAGVGKTALAVHWAHRMVKHFPDGQLYANLRGYHLSPPARPIDVLANFLRALGVPGAEVPVDLDAAAAAYRSLLSGKRVTVVLDNAASADQVRPLLPAGAACLALVTSRDELGGLVALDGARRLGVDAFTAGEATTLLTRILGAPRTGSEPVATAALARRCGYLPLAVRIAAANLAARPTRRIAEHLAELSRDGELEALRITGDERADVRGAFDHSYRPLDSYTKRVFRLLSLVPGPDFTADAAAWLIGGSGERTERALDTLSAAHLLQRQSRARFAFHDLLRLYAAERACAEEPEPARQAAIRRLFAWYLTGADRAARLLYPDAQRLPVSALNHSTPPAPVPCAHPDRDAALSWLHAEHANLVAAIQHAAGQGPYELAYLLTDSLTGYFRMHNHTPQWLTAGQAGLHAAEQAADRTAEAAMHTSLGAANRAAGDYLAALDHYRRAIATHRATGTRDAQADVLARTALVRWEQGELEAARHDLAGALALHRELNDDAGQAHTLDNMACLHYELGHLDEAVVHDTQALAIFRRIGTRSDEVNTLGNLAQFHQELGHLNETFELLGQALALQEHIRSRDSKASILDALAAAHRDAGRHDQAMHYARRCLSLAESSGLRRATIEVRNTIGSVYAATGDHEGALDHHSIAVKTAREIGYRRGEVVGLIGLAVAQHGTGLQHEAADHARRALALARQCRYRLLEGRAQSVLADIELALGHPHDALAHCRRALSIHRRTGHQLDQARTLHTLANALRATGLFREADNHRQEAEALFAAVTSSGRS